MRKWTAIAAPMLFLLIMCSATAANEELDLRKKIERAMNKVYPALVQIYVVSVAYYDGRELKFEAAGSGAIISPDGHVITNHHVVGKAKLIRCRLSNRDELDATLVGTDPLADIAVIKLDLSKVRDKKFKMPVAEFGNSDDLKVGTRVLAMGSPIAISQSVTMGIVSNTQMTVPKMFWPFTFKLDGEEVGTLVKWIAHDAQIYCARGKSRLFRSVEKAEILNVRNISFGRVSSGAVSSSADRAPRGCCRTAPR
ncbi:MAG: trypsin-like peptidase domain-containing protein, partial [Planctomycetota bacterium]